MLSKYKSTIGIFLLAGLSTAVFAQSDPGMSSAVTIGTGGVTGVYYPAGGAVCRLVNRTRSEHGVRCAVRATGGTVINLKALQTGDLELGLAQSDWQHHAYMGTSDTFASDGPDSELRSVFSLHSESFTVLARADSGITSLDDLKGKRVNIGNPGSGQFATMQVLMEAKGWELDDFLEARTFGPVEQASALCDNRIDATVYTVGHPSGVVQEATTTCDVHIIGAYDEQVRSLVEEHSYYRISSIPAGIYKGNAGEIYSFGVVATLVTHSRVPDDVIYALVKAVFDDFDTFKGLHPAFAELVPEAMVREALTAPLHPGARRFYEEKGLILPEDR
ncbi:TAXI family TRAP transporter solute-binding subunit [Nitrincola sp.]|uniref:TAXI family TRAP transporter solute-binding subunit n=1 Tax=Nitrincola sp. TaxID=1926584 RepID=UPI003A8E507E